MQQPLRRPTGTASTRSPTPPAASVADAPARHTVAPGCPPGLNKFSATITQPKSQGASQAMLYATGLREEDMDKPQVSLWSVGNAAAVVDGPAGVCAPFFRQCVAHNDERALCVCSGRRER